jgi:hypothetical protein
VLLVRGDGDVPAFEGVHVVDVTEGSARGFAPAIEVAALNKPFKALPTEAAQVYLSARFLDRAGAAPYAGKALKVEGQQATTDGDGAVVLDDLPWQDVVVAFEAGEVSVPTVHDPSILTRVPLRFVEPGEAPAPVADEREDDEYPSWLPRPDDPFEDEDVPDHKLTGDYNEDDGLDLLLEPLDDEPSDDEPSDAGAATPGLEDLQLLLEPLEVES